MTLQSVLGQVLVRGVIKQASCSEKCYERACVWPTLYKCFQVL